MRTSAISIAAVLLVVGAGSACTDAGPDNLRDQLATPVAFELLPYVSMAELRLVIDGDEAAQDLSVRDGRAVVQVAETGELIVSELEVELAPIGVDGNRVLGDARIAVVAGGHCPRTEWSDDDESCFGSTSAALTWSADSVAAERAPVELMVSASRFEGETVIDLMASERPDIELWPDVRLAAITLVIHGVAR